MAHARTPPTLHLYPPPIPAGALDAFAASARTIRAVHAPSNQVTAFVAPTADALDHFRAKGAAGSKAKWGQVYDQDKRLITAAWNRIPDVKIAFLAESYTVFASLQKIAEQSQQAQAGFAAFGGGQDGGAPRASDLIPSAQQMQYYHRISGLYRQALRAYLQRIEAAPELDEPAGRHAKDLLVILELAEVLYLPSDGRGSGVVGEEVLNWLNAYDVAPSTEEGNDIAQSAVPYQHPSYWDYTLRCVLRGFHSAAASVLQSLTSHPSAAIVRVTTRSVSLLSRLPRSYNFTLEADFVSAHRAWIGAVRAELAGLEAEMDEMEAEAGGGEEAEDARIEFEARFRCLLELMAGVRGRIFEACEDWKEALGAWGTLVQPALKRDDIPETMEVIFEQFPIDGTLPAEAIQAALVKGEVTKAVTLCNELDPWLAAHFTDLLDKVGLVDDQEDFPMRLRDHFVLLYADTLISDSGLWRMTLDYLSVCGPKGTGRMRELISRIPLSPRAAPTKGKGRSLEDVELATAMDQDGDDDDVDGEGAEVREERRRKMAEREREKRERPEDFERVEEVLKACVEYEMEDEARAICKTMAAAMAQQRRYGLAVAYCVRAWDATQVRRIADQLLDEYVSHGSATFVSLVDTIPASLLQPASHSLGGTGNGLTDGYGDPDLLDTDADADGESIPTYGRGRALFSNRLAFLVRYRDFHNLYAQGQMRRAAQLLVMLLTSNVAPQRFWAILLVDAVPLLEGDQDLFTMEETFELLRILEQITSSALTHPAEASHYLGYLERLLSASASSSASSADLSRTKAERTPKAAVAGTAGAATKQQKGRADHTQVDTRRANKRLDVVRLALARHLARASVADLAGF